MDLVVSKWRHQQFSTPQLWNSLPIHNTLHATSFAINEDTISITSISMADPGPSHARPAKLGSKLTHTARLPSNGSKAPTRQSGSGSSKPLSRNGAKVAADGDDSDADGSGSGSGSGAEEESE